LRLLSTKGMRTSFFRETPGAGDNPLPAVSVADAIDDLPVIDIHSDDYRRRGIRRVDKHVPCRMLTPYETYLEQMRSWPGFRSRGMVTGHVTRCLTDRDHRIFAAMPPRAEYPEAHRIAMRLYKAALARRSEGKGSTKLRRRFVPPYDPG